jgi:hypothetical protein
MSRRGSQPSETVDLFTLTLEAGTFTVQCYGGNSRETKRDDTVTVPSAGSISFTAPFVEAGPPVLYRCCT